MEKLIMQFYQTIGNISRALEIFSPALPVNLTVYSYFKARDWLGFLVENINVASDRFHTANTEQIKSKRRLST